jgi:hypothetical protein
LEEASGNKVMMERIFPLDKFKEFRPLQSLMKRTRTFLLLFILFHAKWVSSQTVQWSPPMLDEKKYPYLHILGAVESGYYLLRSNMSFNGEQGHSGFKSRKFLLQLINDDLRAIISQPLVLSCEDCHIADVGIVGSNVAVTYTSFDKANKVMRLFIQKLDALGKMSGDPLLLMEIGAEKADEEIQPDLIYSKDENFIACAMRSVAKDESNQEFTAVIFDTSYVVRARKEISIPVKPKLFGPITSVLSDDGNFYLLGIEFRSEKRVKNPGESFYKLISYNFKKDEVKYNDIIVENKFLTDVAINADNRNKRIVVSGFYSEKTAYSTAGVFYYSLSEDSLVQTPVVTSTFTAEFLRKLVTEGRVKNNELVNYSIDRSVIRKDGGAAIVAESFNISSRSYWDYYMQMWVYHYYYHYGNIIALSINPDGTILWSNTIQKDQNSTDDGGYYSSYFSAILNGRIISIYNKYIGEQSSVLMTTMNGVGEQQTKTLFDQSMNAAVIPHSGRQVDEDTILLPAERNGESLLVKIVF